MNDKNHAVKNLKMVRGIIELWPYDETPHSVTAADMRNYLHNWLLTAILHSNLTPQESRDLVALICGSLPEVIRRNDAQVRS